MAGVHNQGIIINSGTVTAHQLVAGTNARAESIVNGAHGLGKEKTIDDLRAQLDELLTLIKENKHCLAPETEKAIEVVKQEAAKPEPNKIVITSVLDSVSGAVKSVASLAGVLTAVKELAALIL